MELFIKVVPTKSAQDFLFDWWRDRFCVHAQSNKVGGPTELAYTPTQNVCALYGTPACCLLASGIFTLKSLAAFHFAPFFYLVLIYTFSRVKPPHVAFRKKSGVQLSNDLLQKLTRYAIVLYCFQM